MKRNGGKVRKRCTVGKDLTSEENQRLNLLNQRSGMEIIRKKKEKESTKYYWEKERENMTQFYFWLVSTIFVTILSGILIVKYLKKVEK